MKSLLVGDSHWGVSNNNQKMIDQNINIWSYIIKIASEYKVDNIIELGDFLDKRKEIDTNLLQIVRQNVFDKIKIPFYMIVGNHNLYYKDTSTVNNIKVFGDMYDNVTIVDKPLTLNNVDLLPWINNENVEDIRSYIKSSKSKYCLGHFEFNGFQFDKSRVAEVEEKLSLNLFFKYNKVFSGHYHINSEKDNVIYTGTPSQLTWIDSGVEKYIYILDDETNEITTLVIPFTMFIQFEIDENNWKDYCNDNIKDKKVKIIYDENINNEVFNALQTQFIQLNPDVQFIKKPSKIVNKQVVLDESKTLYDSIIDYVDTIEPENKDLVKKLITKVYK